MKHISSITVSEQDTKIHHIGNYSQIPNWVLSDNRLSSTQKIVFSYLFTFNTQNKIAFPSNERIKETCGLKSTRTVQHSLNQLEQLGYIKRSYNQDSSLQGRESIHCALRPEEVGDVPIFIRKPIKKKKI